MTFTPLADRLISMPLLICGPILRRVTSSSVTVWLVTSEAATVTLTVYDNSGFAPQQVPPLPPTVTQRKTNPIGRRLHMVALTARFNDNILKEDVIYSYDLVFDFEEGSGRKMFHEAAKGTAPHPDHVVTAALSEFAYEPYTLPTFALPPANLEKVRIIHGSCRKPNGGGEDMLAFLDDLIAATAEHPLGRPHQLLMTGDQIYADEVAGNLLYMLTDAGDALLGWLPSESMPGPGGVGFLTARSLAPRTRWDVITAAGFTSGDRNSHLMSLGEYLAMYLFAWSPTLWPSKLPTFDDIAMLAEVVREELRRRNVTDAEELLKGLQLQYNNVKKYWAALPKVRRALANIPAYMIFDDHEITDDWNMTREFCEDVYKKDSLGLRIVQNGMVAYALCQGWGNTPEQFEDDPQNPAGKELLTLLSGATDSSYRANAEKIQTIVGLHDAETLSRTARGVELYRVYHDSGSNITVHGEDVNTASIRFHYAIDAAAYQVIVTDTRTWRSWPEPGKVEHPDLLPNLASQLVDTPPPLGDRLQLVVVTTNMPPIPPVWQAEELLPPIKKGFVYKYDLYDSWRFPSASFDLMITRLTDRLPRVLDTDTKRDTHTGRVIFLSGDVHSSYASRIGYWAGKRYGDVQSPPQPGKAVFAQLVASSFKNSDEKTEGQHKQGYEFVPGFLAGLLLEPIKVEGAYGWARNPLSKTWVKVGTRDVQTTVSGAPFPTPPRITTADVYVSGAEPSRSFNQFYKEFLGVQMFFNPTITTPPDYEYRSEQIFAAATGQFPGPAPQIPSVGLTGDAAARRRALAIFNKASAAYRNYKNTAGAGQQIVGRSNICEITFTWGADDNKHVHHTVRWYPHTKNGDHTTSDTSTVAWARYSVSLELNNMTKFGKVPFPVTATLLTALRDELGLLIEPLVEAVEDEASARRLLAALGADESFPNKATLLHTLESAVALRIRIDAVVDAPQPSLADIAAALTAAGDLFHALRDIDSAADNFTRLGADVVALLTGEYLRIQHPLLYASGALLTLVEDPFADPMPGVARNGQVVRLPFPCARIRFERLHQLINDPQTMLHEAYFPNGLETVADANAAADLLFPRVAAILTQFQAFWSYGVREEDLGMLGDAAPLVDHAFQVYVPPERTGSDAEAGITFTLSSADRAGLGLVLSPFGSLEFSGHLGRVKVDAKLGAEVEALAIGPQGPTFIAGPDTVAVNASFKASLIPDTPGEPAFIVGAATGTRLELGTAEFGVTIDMSLDDANVAASAAVSSGLLVIASADADGFLASFLPADGIRTAFDLGLAWSSEKGLTFRGHAGLDATIPVGQSVAGVTLTSVHLGLQARDASVLAEVSATLGASIGPVRALVDRFGIEAVLTFPGDGGNVGVANLEIGIKPPSGVGLTIDARPVTGGGVLRFDPERAQYSGEMVLEFEGIAVKAVGLLTTRLPDGAPGFSLLVLVSAEFPPIELGLGFRLVGVGGLLGVNRTVAVEALRAGVKTGALGAVLSPPDPIANAGQLVASLAGLFPPAAGRHVFGPTARIVWGSPTLITIELCLVLELPAPVRLVALGRVRAVLPGERAAVVVLQMDVLGVVDFDRREASVDATLIDSRLAQFVLTGDMALRMSWGSQSTFLLAVGGFHPRFAAPPGFPALTRVAVALASGENPKLRLEAYLALTSNTVQFGARVDLYARAGRFSIAGFLSFDALVRLDPLAFIVEIAAKLAVKAGGHALLSVSLALTLSGPQPWRARGRASFSILFFDVSFGFDVTIGDGAAPALPPPVDVAMLVRAAFADPRSWSAQLPAGGAALVTLRAVDPGTEVLAHPLGTLEVRQRVAPLERTLERFGSSVPSGARRFRIVGATTGPPDDPVESAVDTGVRDLFAPAQFGVFSDDEKLSLPSFVLMRSGAVIGAAKAAHGAPVSVTIGYEEMLVTAEGITVRDPV